MKDDLETSFSFWYWEEDTFTNGNFPHQCKYPSQKGNFCSIFTVSPMSISKKKKKKKKNQLKIIFVSKMHVLG